MPLPALILEWLAAYKYLFVFLLAVVEGPVIMTVSGFFLRLGHFDFFPLYLTLMAGDLFADALWYTVGYYGAHPLVRKYGRFLSINEGLLEKTRAKFTEHQNKILFLSKITMGFGFALLILITAGMMRIPFKKYIAFNALGQLVWTTFLLGVGYAFGNLYLVINKGLRITSFIAFLVVVSAAIYGINRYLRGRELQNNKS